MSCFHEKTLMTVCCMNVSISYHVDGMIVTANYKPAYNNIGWELDECDPPKEINS